MNTAPSDRSEICRTTEADLPAIAELAGVIWRACYPGIISHAQIDYMLARMYALDTMREEIHSQGIRYDRLLVARQTGRIRVLWADRPGRAC